ncbi:hypothetical protein PGT21_015368 [Puccinia graminis f. sp. tritici]|uniref:Uncharacterized protein n=1 Tax=Puccinia graminis f. sp. tritici TaxID=56615 RepID=A0A5B0LV22_PUCGR|nr:hypothetical protein PGT21_015368 [Puccinia graminis f. sp. tritici]KAA1093533.1 hypothetical protein PGTUg99_026002 [Puccinia graminis f. sp. tritici]
MIEHLRRLHGIYPPDQEKTNQLLLPNLLKRQRVEQRAISYLVAEANLPYSIVEHKSFQHLLEILNPATLNMDYGRKTISKEVDMLYNMVHKNSIQEIIRQVKQRWAATLRYAFGPKSVA